MRASLHEGVLPRKNAVRIEELINYFPYDYAPPETSTLITRPVTPADTFESVGAAPRDTRFAAAVAAFGQLLRGGRYTGDYGCCWSQAGREPMKPGLARLSDASPAHRWRPSRGRSTAGAARDPGSHRRSSRQS